jgi:solute carrier family 35 protein E2
MARSAEATSLMSIGFFLFSWYFCSMMTLFMNKYYLQKEGLGGTTGALAMAQMLTSLVTGGINFYAEGVDKTKPTVSSSTFYQQMVVVGLMRFGAVTLGLIALGRLAVSFTETVKSSAPFVTVVFSFVILGERTSWTEFLSLMPVVLGLALCSFTEVSFNQIGFIAAMSTNCVDCMQNVYSKKLMTYYTATQLQFYATSAALVVQLPAWVAMNGIAISIPPMYNIGYLIVDGIFFYLQSITAYRVVALVSPVTMSVANCVKRAFLIWLSTLAFGNAVGMYNGLGTLMLISGVMGYNYVKQQAGAGKGKTAMIPQSLPQYSPSGARRRNTGSFPPLTLCNNLSSTLAIQRHNNHLVNSSKYNITTHYCNTTKEPTHL